MFEPFFMFLKLTIMTTKILIYVEGGTVQFVNANHKDVQIVIIDKDNMTDDNNGFISGCNEPDRVIENHYEAFVEEDAVGSEIYHELKRMKF